MHPLGGKRFVELEMHLANNSFYSVKMLPRATITVTLGGYFHFIGNYSV